jgi:hypothetical protein
MGTYLGANGRVPAAALISIVTQCGEISRTEERDTIVLALDSFVNPSLVCTIFLLRKSSPLSILAREALRYNIRVHSLVLVQPDSCIVLDKT